VHQRDEQGRVFLDHDPVLLAAVLAWLRQQGIAGPGTPPLQPAVPPGSELALLALLDFLGLQRHVPCRWATCLLLLLALACCMRVWSWPVWLSAMQVGTSQGRSDLSCAPRTGPRCRFQDTLAAPPGWASQPLLLLRGAVAERQAGAAPQGLYAVAASSHSHRDTQVEFDVQVRAAA
jgi:hypothetical protein